MGDNYYNGSQYCWSPDTCAYQIDGTSSSCWPNCNTDLFVEGSLVIGEAFPIGLDYPKSRVKLDVGGSVRIGKSQWWTGTCTGDMGLSLDAGCNIDMTYINFQRGRLPPTWQIRVSHNDPTGWGGGNRLGFTDGAGNPTLTLGPSPQGNLGDVGIRVMVPEANFQVNGTMKIFGLWQTKSEETTYQADTDGFVIAYADNAIVTGLTDGSNPPTTKRAEDGMFGSARGSIIMPVRKGDYWRVNISATGVVYWLPFGV